MQVFWDGYGLDHPSGVATYGEQLAGGLNALGLVPEVLMPKAVFPKKLSCSKPLWSQRVARMVAARAVNGAVLHGLSNFNLVRPRGCNVRTVLTVHDLIPFLCREGVSAALYWQLYALLPRALAAADAVICVSEWTRAHVADRWPWAQGKLTVIRHGVAPVSGLAPFNRDPSGSQLDDRRPHRSPVFCPDELQHQAVPTIEQRSPTENRKEPLLTSPVGMRPSGSKRTMFYQARGEIYKQIKLYLDIVGAMPPNEVQAILLTDARGKEQALVSHPQLVAQGRLAIHVGVSAQAYEAFFERADVYVHTSKFEGYCLPAADALRHGVPVVYQSGSAIDELLGADVGTPMAPQAGVSDWVSAVYEAARHKGGRVYEEGRRRRLAGLPSWEDTARAHAAVYSAV